MSETTIFWIIWSITYVSTILGMLYIIFKLDDICGNLEDRFTYFNEELVILSEVLKDYEERLDQDNVPTIPHPTQKNVSGW